LSLDCPKRVFMRLPRPFATTLRDCEILLRVLGIFPGAFVP
jgi:hypothetical protein